MLRRVIDFLRKLFSKKINNVLLQDPVPIPAEAPAEAVVTTITTPEEVVMDQFKDIALPLILVFEGSKFTNHPADKGGPTKYGIIQTVYDKYRKDKGLPLQTVANITLQEVQDIYYVGYWVPAKCQEMPGKLSIAVFDTTVNSGQGRSIKILQQAIGAKVDGVIGPETLSKLKTLDETKVANQYIDSRENFFRAIVARDATQSVFLDGWLRRAKYLRAFINGTKTLDQIKKEW